MAQNKRRPVTFSIRIYSILAIALSCFVLLEANYPLLSPQARLAFFAMLGLLLVFLSTPMCKSNAKIYCRGANLILLVGLIFAFCYVIVQSETLFSSFWIDGNSLGNRAGREQPLDIWVGIIGLVIVLEGARRAIGLTLPLLAIIFILYAVFGSYLPDWLFPHRGYSLARIVSQTFLHSQGVFGIALKVMFTYVFLFVLFGALLEKTGATGFIIDFARRLFRNSSGGPAKVAVISSGMMGSLSGSAVANTATTGTFTIPMMRSAGFKPEVAAGIEAAASSGGALVPPIMGAGAYMMLEIIEPSVTYIQIIQSALLPAILYYFSLLLIVHLQALKVGASAEKITDNQFVKPASFPGWIFLSAFISLIALLLMGYTPFRAVSLSMLVILLVAAFKKETRVDLSGIASAMVKAAKGGVALIAAASCVGVIIGVVTLTGVGAKLPGIILPLAQNNLLAALFLLMISTIILGMGLPSAVCYLLMATLIGPTLGNLGLVPLASHLFIFYFGMMSMVTPPVALAAYTAAAIAESGIMQSSLAAFRFALVGFALPYAFVLKPELLLLTTEGGVADFSAIAASVAITVLGIIPLAAGVTGRLFGNLSTWQRIALTVAGLLLILSKSSAEISLLQTGSFLFAAAFAYWNWRTRRRP